MSVKMVLITGGARRIGRALAVGAARAGAAVILHHGHSPAAAEAVRKEIEAFGGVCHPLQADLALPAETDALMERALAFGPLDALVHNAAIFEPQTWNTTDRAAWQRHIEINLTAPFFLSQVFARRLLPDRPGRIVTILDWRALRPGADHLPYTVSKAGLAALTQSLAQALAPQIAVNGIALGAILPPADGAADAGLLEAIPAKRWAALDEVVETLLFLLNGPAYITGEIIHLDGGRHLR
jgi:NAD(P)-dependent dehydrogenase (short-subunit alcohol dehydrogenase family)